MADRTGPVLRGRDAQLAAVDAHLARVRSGVGSVMIVEGDAGLGKTSILAEATARARRADFGTGVGTADQGRSVVDMAALMEALFGGTTPLLDRGALGIPETSREARFWLLQDIQSLLETAALRRPLLIVLDDMQWADVGCAFALRVLPPWLTSLPVGWMIAIRPGEGTAPIDRMLAELRDAGAETVDLGALDSSAVAQLAADVLGATANAEVLDVAARVDGNPFMLVDLLSGLRDEGLVTVVGARVRLIEDRVPARTGESVHRRLTRMDPPAERIATLASALGRQFSVESLAAMGGFTVAELVDPVRDLMHAGVFAETGTRLAFRHDLIREAVREVLPPAVRQALDREAADVLLASGAPPVEVAAHLVSSAEPGDEAAIATLLEAADSLATTDPSASADIAQSALDLAPARHPLRGPLTARRTVSLFASGRSSEARTFSDSALGQSLPAEHEAQLRLGISGMYTVSADVRAENARTALALPGLPADLRARLCASLLSNLLFAGRFDEAGGVWDQMAAEVLASGDTAAHYLYEGARMVLEYQEGRFGHALAEVEDLERQRTSSLDDPRERLTHNFRSWLLEALDRFDDAMTEFESGLSSAQRDRQNWAIHMLETWRGRHLLQAGRLEEAAAALEGRFALAEASSVVGVLDAASVTALGRVALHRGDQRAANEIAEIAKVVLTTTPPGVRRHAAWFLALQSMAQGEPSEAHDWLCATGEEERLSLFPLLPLEVADDPQLVRIAVATGDDELARHAISRAERRRELNPGAASLDAFAAHARGLLSGSSEDLERAVAGLDGGPRPLALSSALEDLGCAKLGAGATSDVIDIFDRALAINVGVGATWDAARVRRRLRDMGIRRRVVALDRPMTGWAALTEAELRVARLTADGHTNRAIGQQLFVSPHTVNTHLRHIFEKLGVRSRVDLTRIVDREAAVR